MENFPEPEKPAESVEKTESKYEILVSTEVKELLIFFKDFVERIHDFNPDYIFLTETRAVPYGYVFKEAWKYAYKGEKIPTFYRIDPRALPEKLASDEDLGLDAGIGGVESFAKKKGTPEAAERYFERLKLFLKSRIKKEKPRIAVFDEWGTGTSPKAVMFAITDLLGVNTKDIQVFKTSHRSTLLDFSKFTTKASRIAYALNNDKITLDDIRFKGTINKNSDGNRMPRNSHKFSKEEIDEFEEMPELDRLNAEKNQTNPQFEKARRLEDAKAVGHKIIPKDQMIEFSSGNLIRINSLDFLHDLKQLGKEVGEALNTESDKGNV